MKMIWAAARTCGRRRAPWGTCSAWTPWWWPDRPARRSPWANERSVLVLTNERRVLPEHLRGSGHGAVLVIFLHLAAACHVLLHHNEAACILRDSNYANKEIGFQNHDKKVFYISAILDLIVLFHNGRDQRSCNFEKKNILHPGYTCFNCFVFKTAKIMFWLSWSYVIRVLITNLEGTCLNIKIQIKGPTLSFQIIRVQLFIRLKDTAMSKTLSVVLIIASFCVIKGGKLILVLNFFPLFHLLCIFRGKRLSLSRRLDLQRKNL